MILWSAEGNFTIQMYYRIFFYKVFNIIIFSLRMWQRWRYISVCRVGPCQWLPHHSEDTHWVHGWDNQDQRMWSKGSKHRALPKVQNLCYFARMCISEAPILDVFFEHPGQAETWKDSPQDKVGRNRIPQQGGWGHQSRGCLRPDFHARQINLLQPALSSSNSTSSSWLRSQWKSNRNDNFCYLWFLIFFIKIHTDPRNLPT